MKAVLIAAAVGGLGMLALFARLNVEKSHHADTRQELAAARIEAARYATQVANAAAARAQAVAEAVEAASAEQELLRQNEQALRLSIEQLRAATTTRRTQADAMIGRLVRENEDLRAWAATRVPDAWVAWLRGELAETPVPAR